MSKPDFLERYVNYTSNVWLADKVVKCTGYACGTTAAIIKTLFGPDNEVGQDIDKIAAMISSARMVYRIAGIWPSLLKLRENTGAGKAWKDPRIHLVAKMVDVANIFYHALEHFAWSAGHVRALQRRIPGGMKRCWAIANFWWLAWVLLDMVSTALKLRELKKVEADLFEALGNNKPNEANIQTEIAGVSIQRRALHIQLVRLWLFLPNAYNWALEDAIIPRGYVQFMGFLEGFYGTVMSFPRK